jgi:hypothetical protein
MANNLIGSRHTLGDKDYSRAYLFSIDIPQIFSGGEQALSTICRATKLPDFEIATDVIDYDGIKINIAQSVKFPENWRVEFLSDENYTIKRNVLHWMAQTVDPARMVPSAPDVYKVDGITASQLDRKGNKILTYTFYGVFPVKLDKTAEFSHKLRDINEFTVEFKFDYFTMAFNDAVKPPKRF